MTAEKVRAHVRIRGSFPKPPFEPSVSAASQTQSHVTSYRLRFVTMTVQEVKPEGRRLIGYLSLRAAHNVHKVDVCACSLSPR